MTAPTGVVHEVRGSGYGYGCVPYAQEGRLLPANRDDVFPGPLVLDESRLTEVDEAWCRCGPHDPPKGSTGFPLALAVDWSTRVSSLLPKPPFFSDE
ncbi:hypothetical protein [Streptomyces sp. NPDC020377]|uniref:hypothetical protein n=1 Tax=Streptomyces sp. NPDC020377 TaxID=3365070 RepID=UPI0037A64824